MAEKIDTVSARDKLKPRREPYWQRLSTGCYVGYRKMKVGRSGNWSARYREDDGSQTPEPFGTLEQFPAHQRFDEAVKLARTWFDHRRLGGAPSAGTVREACAIYAAKIETGKGLAQAKDLRGRYRRLIDADPIGEIKLSKLAYRDVEAWRNRITQAPLARNSATPKKRSDSTINRDMTALRAALRHAYARKEVISDAAWKDALKAIDDATVPRELYLPLSDRKKLIEACEIKELAWFLEGLSRLPLRPGALAKLDARHFERHTGALTIGQDKTGRRQIQLPKSTREFFLEITQGKKPTEPLFSCPYEGGRWNKDNWKYGVKAAASAAELPPTTIAMTLRHSTITDLVMGGLNLFSVATLAGTSVLMIQKHYGHLNQGQAAKALEALDL